MEDRENRQRKRGDKAKGGKESSEVAERKPFHLPSELLSHEASLTFTESRLHRREPGPRSQRRHLCVGINQSGCLLRKHASAKLITAVCHRNAPNRSEMIRAR